MQHGAALGPMTDVCWRNTRRLRGAWFAIGLAALLGACAQKPAAVVPTAPAIPPAQLEAATSLGAFYGALDGLRSGTRQDPVVVLQIGDSHTANAVFSARMRALLQARFGNAGRGILQAGIPFRYYNADGVHVTAKGWTVISSFRSSSVGPFGIAGLRQHAAGRAVMTMTGESAGALDDASLEVLLQPGGGDIRVSFDTGKSMLISTDAPVESAVSVTLPSLGANVMTVKTVNRRPVDLLSWTVQRKDRGVIYANLGTIGATVGLIERWDPVIVQQEIARLQPSLIVLEFGTNEGFGDSTDVDSYGAVYKAQLDLLHQDAPQASVLVIGPPDGVRKWKAGTLNAGNCGVYLSASGEPEDWVRPKNLDLVREAQRSVAQQEGFYFWDWSKAMGGACSMAGWAAMTPPLGARDHVHLLADGYQKTADQLFNTLMDGYSGYELLKQAH